MEFRTQRLKIRPIQMEDKVDLFEYRSDPETFKHLSVVPEKLEDIENFIKNSSIDINIPGTWFQFVIILKGKNKLIGDVGVHFLDTDSTNQQVEIGYTLNRNFRGQGFAYETLTEIIDYLFISLHKHRIIASIDPSNFASIKLIEKLGFRKEAHFRKSLFFHGEWVDDLVYAQLKSEWTENRHP